MELAQYLMMANSMKRSRHNSWEENAFAEDHIGGIVWPPRSYSCTFCRREFRSAQALGGHMNVHRRDRARLKHSSSLLPNPNPNLNPNPNPRLFRVSVPQHHYKGDEQINNEGGVLSSSSSYSSYSVMIAEKERSRLVLDDGIMGFKRVKVSNICSTMFPDKKCLSEEGVFVEEEEEELDLELRLGNTAKVI